MVQYCIVNKVIYTYTTPVTEHIQSTQSQGTF